MQMPALMPAQDTALPTAQAIALTSAQAARLTPAQIAALAPAQTAELPTIQQAVAVPTQQATVGTIPEWSNASAFPATVNTPADAMAAAISYASTATLHETATIQYTSSDSCDEEGALAFMFRVNEKTVVSRCRSANDI
jgi:hypothetical protein